MFEYNAIIQFTLISQFYLSDRVAEPYLLKEGQKNLWDWGFKSVKGGWVDGSKSLLFRLVSFTLDLVGVGESPELFLLVFLVGGEYLGPGS